MSSFRAIYLPTAPVESVPAATTDAYVRPRLRAAVPEWHYEVEAVIRAVGRFGLGPLPCVALGFVLAVGASLRLG